jgi:hypothetical protein
VHQLIVDTDDMSRKAMLQIQTPDEAETVFYEAFIHGDGDVMAALWADVDVVCVHPGSGLIHGHDAVVRSWSHILEHTQGSDIRYTAIKKSITDELAVHIVTEELMDGGSIMGVVIATNVYQKFDKGWLMIEHHGSLIQQQHEGETLQ